MKLTISCASVQTNVEIGEEEGCISTLGQLREQIASDNDIDVETMKLLHRGREK